MPMIEFDCEICGTHKRKAWSASMPGRPRFCCWDCKSESQRRARPVTREWLEEKYITEGLDCVQIGKLVSRDPKSVWNWLKSWRIQTRPRGVASPCKFKKGQRGGFSGHKHSVETKEKLRRAAIADGRRPYDPQVGPPFRGKRGAETPNWKGGVTPERQSLYSSPQWAEAVKAVWSRAGARCERCGVHHNTTESRGTFHVHHIESFAVTALRSDPSNLALLCRACHHFVHSKRNVDNEFIATSASGPGLKGRPRPVSRCTRCGVGAKGKVRL